MRTPSIYSCRRSFLSCSLRSWTLPDQADPYELLRINTLNVFVCLVQVDDNEVASFLVQTEIIPLCLHIMEKGNDVAKTSATYIIQRLLLNQKGLNYVCHTAERFVLQLPHFPCEDGGWFAATYADHTPPNCERSLEVAWTKWMPSFFHHTSSGF